MADKDGKRRAFWNGSTSDPYALTSELEAHDHVANLEADSRLMTDPPTDYPMGFSVMPSVDNATPETFSYEWSMGTVQTTRYVDDDDLEHTSQLLIGGPFENPPIYWRFWVTDGTPHWSDFQEPARKLHEHDHVANLEADSRLATDGPTAFPLGQSIMPSIAEGTSNTFANAYWGEDSILRTTRYQTGATERCIQEVYDIESAQNFAYRVWTGAAWYSWTEIVSFDSFTWGNLTGKPSTFPPSAHAASHKGDGSDAIANATTSTAGLESAADKTKLDGIEAGATADMAAAELRTAIAGGTISTNFLDLPEQGSPTNPAADTGRLYAVDRGGKTEPQHRDSNGDTRYPFQDSYFVGQNTTGGTLAKGTVVRVTSLSGTDIPIIASADADAASTMPAAGILMEAVTNNNYGRVMFQGVLTGITTTGLAAGSPLYASGTAGGFTQTAPVYPALRQVLGSVLSVGASGVLLVNVSHFFRAVGVPVSMVFFEGGTLATKTGVGRFPITTNTVGTITECRAWLDTASSSGSVVVGFRKTGAASFTTITIAASATSGSSTGLSVAMATTDYLTVDITSAGTGAANLTLVAEMMTAA